MLRAVCAARLAGISSMKRIALRMGHLDWRKTKCEHGYVVFLAEIGGCPRRIVADVKLPRPVEGYCATVEFQWRCGPARNRHGSARAENYLSRRGSCLRMEEK